MPRLRTSAPRRLRLTSRIRPATPLEQLRWAFLAFSAAMALAMVLLLLLVSAEPMPSRAAGVIAVTLLLSKWCWGFWRGFTRWSVIAEGIFLFVGASALTAPSHALGLFYVGIYLRVLYEGARGTAALAAAYVLALGGAIALADTGQDSLRSPFVWLQLAGLAISATAMYLLASAMARHERALARERLLSATGARLAGARMEQEVADIAAEAADALLHGHARGRVALASTVGDRVVVRAARGPESAGWVGQSVPLASLASRLSSGGSARRISPGDADTWRQLEPLAPSPRGSVLVVPLHVREGWQGMLLAEEVGALPAELEPSLGSLATQVALAFESRARTDAFFRSCVQHSSDVITIVRPDGIVQYQSPAIRRVFGHDAESLPGTDITSLVHPDDQHHLRLLLAAGGAPDTPHVRCDCRLQHADGGWRDAEITITDLRDDPNVSAIVLNTRDMTAQRALESQLAHQAFHDPLTGLANRALFRDRVVHAMVHRQRRLGDVVVVFLDVDNFKTVNDGLGHSAGDHLLILVAQRLLGAVRTADTVARLGGDEFGILMEDVKHESDVEQVAERVLAAMRAPVTLEGRAATISVSMGSARARPEDDTEVLLRNADAAMYAAKQRGKGRHEPFVPEMHEAARERLEIAAGLRQALRRGEFRVFYQPIVDVAGGRIQGVEALVRWEHPERGRVSPATFIPVAEDTGFIIDLGRWVLRESCRQAMAWRGALGSARELGVSVNVSGRQLSSVSFTSDVAETLLRTGLPAHALTLEITESVVVERTESVIERLSQLRDMGVRLAIDDFGTGYSSLSYLHRLPIDALKIDRSFTQQLGSGERDAALARAIVALGRTLNLRTVAEGVETEGQRDQLAALGCELAQGYLFAPPLPAAEVAELLERQPTLHEHQLPAAGGHRLTMLP